MSFPPYRCLSSSVAGIGSDAWLRKNPVFVTEISARMGVCSVPQSCSTLCDPMDCSAPGSSAHGIFQPRILAWVASFSSRGSSPRQGSNLHLLQLLLWQVGSLPLSHLKPMRLMVPNQMPSSQSLFHWGKPIRNSQKSYHKPESWSVGIGLA